MTVTTPAPAPALRDRLAELGPRVVRCGVYGPEGAAVYDDLASGDTQEVVEVLRLLRGTDGPVLDLAAGAGRFTLPLLAVGAEVAALDLSPHMLSLLKDALAAAPPKLSRRCTVVEADMTAFDLPGLFAVALLGTTSISLLDAYGRAGLYRCVAAHLRPGGRFVLSVLEHEEATGSGETVTRVTGVSGTTYDLFQRWPGPGSPRDVAIVPTDPPPGPVPVCMGEVGTTGTETIRAELLDAGFRVTSCRPLTTQGTRHVVHMLVARVPA